MTGLKLIFENANPMPLVLESQGIEGASWATPLPTELKPGKTDGGYGVASTDGAFGGHFVYVAQGDHVLGVTFQVTEAGEIKVDCNQSPPFHVTEQAEKPGDTWIVSVIYAGPF